MTGKDLSQSIEHRRRKQVDFKFYQICFPRKLSTCDVGTENRSEKISVKREEKLLRLHFQAEK